MAAAVQAHEKECAVCTNEFDTPKILPCGHLLCRQCVISWLNSKSDAGCPLCTCPIVEYQSNSSQSSVDVTDALPTDYVMEAIVESFRVLVKDDVCTVCDDVRAEYICMQCLEKMCPSCMKIHKKMVVSRSHDVESLSTVTLERLAASRPALCADHGDEKANMFCRSHHLVICTSCFSNKHNECPDVASLDDQINLAEKELGLLTKELVKAEFNLKQAIGKLTVRIQTADTNELKNMALVDKTCDRLQKMVEEYRKELKKLISDPFIKFKTSQNDLKSELETRLGKVTSHKHLVTRATTVRPRPALIHAAQTLTDRVSNLNLSAELETEAWVNPSQESLRYWNGVVQRIQAELQSIKKIQIKFEDEVLFLLSTAQAPVFVFHKKCGTNVSLMNCSRTARVQSLESVDNGVVVSRDAMIANFLYERRARNSKEFSPLMNEYRREVQIDDIRINNLLNNKVFLGVTGIPPPQIIVTELSHHLEESVIIGHNGVRCRENIFKSDVGDALQYIKVGSRIGLLVDSSNDLHLYVDGHDQGVAAKGVAQPCFAVFELIWNVIQLTALPTSSRT